MTSELKTLRELKEKTLEEIISKFGKGYGGEFTEMKLSIWDVRCILYDNFNRIVEREIDNLKGEFIKK